MAPAHVLQAPLGGQLGGDLDEHLGLQLGEVLQVAAHPAGRVVLGQPAHREDEREDLAVLLRRARVHPVLRVLVHLAGRVGLLARTAGCGRPTRPARSGSASARRPGPCGTNSEPLPSPCMMNGSSPASPSAPLAPSGGRYDGALSTSKSGTSWPVHAPCLLVPPDVGLALAPRLALGVGRGAVVEHAAVRRPRPAPLRGHPGLLGARGAPGGLVDAVRVDTGVDPAAAEGGPVVLHLGVAGQRTAGGDLHPVDLPQHRLGAGLVLLAVRGVVPGEVQQRPVALGRGPGQPLPDHPAEVVEEPQLGAAVARPARPPSRATAAPAGSG